AAHMVIANEDLRNRAAAGDAHHLLAQRRIEVDAQFLELGHAAAVEQLLGADAVGAHRAGVHAHGRGHFLPFGLRPVVSGLPAFSHSVRPPLRLNTLSKPALRSLAVAVRERAPEAQHRISGASLSFSSSGRRRSSSPSGMWRALGMWPLAY